MTFEQLKDLVDCGQEIEFSFKGKRYSITYWYPNDDENDMWISFCEFYKETTEVRTANELWSDVSRDGFTVGQMLSSIEIEDVDVF